MKKISETILFFGSGPVAADSLLWLANNFNIEAVITKPKKEHHIGDVPVLDITNKLKIKTYQAIDKLSLEEIFETNHFESKLAILIDYGIIISQKIIDYFPLGIINSHFSILPEWRGADPITFAILSGQQETGVSLMKLTTKMDEGPLLNWQTIPLDNTETTPILTEKLINLSNKLIIKTIPNYLNNKIIPQDQKITKKNISYSRKITKNDGKLNFSLPAEQLERQIRAYINWPKSKTIINNIPVAITKVKIINQSGEPGIFFRFNNQLAVYCYEKALLIEELIPDNKKRMTSTAFMAGHKI